jgi:hypothetical protein
MIIIQIIQLIITYTCSIHKPLTNSIDLLAFILVFNFIIIHYFGLQEYEEVIIINEE